MIATTQNVDNWEIEQRRRELAETTWALVPGKLVGKPIEPKLREAVDNWRGGGLILCGATGAGKSAACVALVRRLCRAGAERGGSDFNLARSLYWVQGDDLRAAGGTTADASAQYMIRRARLCRLLILDDFPVDPGKTILALLKHRDHAGRATVVTSGDIDQAALVARLGGVATLRWILDAAEPLGRVVFA